MFTLDSVLTALLFTTIITAAALQSVQTPNPLLEASTPQNLSASEIQILTQINNTLADSPPSPLLNLSVPKTTLKTDQVLIDCSYGHELEYSSCLEALNTFIYPFPDRALTIGQRWTGGVWDLNLPVRWMSANGYCTWDIIQTSHAAYSLATGAELVAAATEMLDECVLGNRGQGGVATNIGARGDISLILRPNIPQNLECPGEAVFNDHCNALVSTLPATDTPEIFGPENSPLTTVVLPKAWASRRPNGCIMAIVASSGESDVQEIATFYDLWQAFVTVTAMCVRQNRTGKISVGRNGKLTMAVLPEFGSAAQS